MNYKILILFIVCSFNFCLGQTGIDNALKEIAVNNLQIKAGSGLSIAKKMEFNTGLAPYDPVISYDHLFGSPKEAGEQKDLSVYFSFDFPTVYGKKSTLSDLMSSQTIYDDISIKRNILLEAKLICIEIIYLNSRNTELKTRLAYAQQLQDYFVKKLETGDGNIIDVNKAKFQVITYQSELDANQTEINSANNSLTSLNGGKPIIITDTLYPVINNIPDFVTLEKEIEENDPEIKKLLLQYQIAKQEVEVNKALNLPKFEIGYRYQGLLNEKYNGIHAGVTIPLWERNNIVKSKELLSSHSLSLIEAHKVEHYYETKNLYDEFIRTKKNFEETTSLMQSVNNYELLTKAYSLGEMSSINYILELTFYYSMKDKMDILERNYHLAYAKLFKQKLN